MNRLSFSLATLAAAALLASSTRAQTIGCVAGGAGGPVPVTGTGGGTFPGTLPTSPGVYTLNVAAVPPGATVVTEVKLLAFTHTYVGDLQFVLTAPTGALHNLIVRRTGSCDLAGDYTVKPSCTGGLPYPASCTTTLAPGAYDQFFGTWPDGTHGMFNTPLDTIPAATGLWTLTAYDWAGADVGNLTTWELCFGTPPPPTAPGGAPELTAPADGATVLGPAVSLTWAATDCTTSYDVEVDGVVTNTLTPSFAYNSTAGVHNWRVRAVNAIGAGPWSATRVFTDLGPPPGACTGPQVTTLFAQNNGLGAGSIVYFDINVTNPAGISVSQLDTNANATAGTAISLDVYTKSGTYAGFETDVGAWTLVSSGAGVGSGINLPTVIEIADFTLAPGAHALGLVITGGGHSYTGGTGANQSYSNADFSLSLGASQATPFSSSPFTPRVWNGALRYNCNIGPTTYCTAGTTTNGCLAAMSATAQPSASFATACQIDVAGVEGQRQGLIFYGVDNTGFNPLSWGVGSSSYFCVKSPVQRAVAMNSGGAVGACDGSLTMNWNTYQAANPAALGNPFLSGATVYVQAWFSDPPAPRTTNLSDALVLTVGP